MKSGEKCHVLRLVFLLPKKNRLYQHEPSRYIVNDNSIIVRLRKFLTEGSKNWSTIKTTSTVTSIVREYFWSNDNDNNDNAKGN